MSARAVFPHLPAESWERFLADELAPDAARRVEAHLAECADCRAALERADASFLFRRLRDEAPPAEALDDLWMAIEAEVRATPAPRPDAAGRLSRNSRLSLIGGASAAAAILVVAFLSTSRPPSLGEPPITATTQVPADSQAKPEPCPTVIAASLQLTREECLALYGGPIQADEPAQVVVSGSLDLRGL